MPTNVLIMGAAGRDFHNFNTVYRDNDRFRVVAFTATQIPNIDGRRYPAALAGRLYPEGIPIHREEDLERLVKDLAVDEVVFAYSDVSHETWAFLRLGTRALAGVELGEPIINKAARELGFTNETGYGGSVLFYKNTVGLGLLDECRRYWRENDRDLEDHVLMHLATSAEPSESLINVGDASFAEPGDMPLKIQAFCRMTGQIVPRKPGAIIRCLLESRALQYRKTLQDIELLSGGRFTRLYLFDEAKNTLLNHFVAI